MVLRKFYLLRSVTIWMFREMTRESGRLDEGFLRDLVAEAVNQLVPVITRAGDFDYFMKILCQNVVNLDWCIQGLKGPLEFIFTDPETRKPWGFPFTFEFDLEKLTCAEEDMPVGRTVDFVTQPFILFTDYEHLELVEGAICNMKVVV